MLTDTSQFLNGLGLDAIGSDSPRELIIIPLAKRSLAPASITFIEQDEWLRLRRM